MNEKTMLTTENQSLRPAEELLYHLQYATREAETILRGGIVEVAVRNRRVAEYCEHWEGRALKAEADLELLAKAGCKVREHEGRRFVEIVSDVQP